MTTFGERLQHAWNAFLNKDQTKYVEYGSGSGYRMDRRRFRSYRTDKSIVTALYNRIAIDVASIEFQHVRVDNNGRYVEEIDSGLNYCLNTEANIDQTGRSLIQDIAFSLCEEGVVAVVPVDTTFDPTKTGSYDIESLRVGKIVDWYPEHVKIDLYNDRTGKHEEIMLPKKVVAIIENPLYSVMNSPSSTMQRLIRKLSILDAIDEQSGSGKMDLIIQLPYTVKTDLRKSQAEQRRKDVEMQLTNTKYGIAYIDSTEKVIQLNRSIENNLLSQIQYLMNLGYAQLGISEAVFNGTADEQTMLNYYNRTIEPFCSAIADEMKRKFLTKTARTQRQSILFFRDPFKLVPTSQIAEIADKFTRNEIASTNEMRSVIGWKPSDDPRADELRNKNLNESPDAQEPINISESTEGEE